MKKICGLLLLVLCASLLYGCGSKEPDWVDCGTLKAAHDAAGFYCDAPLDAVSGAESQSFRAADGIIEVIWFDTDGQELVRMRKGTDPDAVFVETDSYEQIFGEFGSGSYAYYYGTLSASDKTVYLIESSRDNYAFRFNCSQGLSLTEAETLFQKIS